MHKVVISRFASAIFVRMHALREEQSSMHSSFPLSERFAHCISVGVVQTVIVNYKNTRFYGVLLSHC